MCVSQIDEAMNKGTEQAFMKRDFKKILRLQERERERERRLFKIVSGGAEFNSLMINPYFLVLCARGEKPRERERGSLVCSVVCVLVLATSQFEQMLDKVRSPEQTHTSSNLRIRSCFGSSCNTKG